MRKNLINIKNKGQKKLSDKFYEIYSINCIFLIFVLKISMSNEMGRIEYKTI